MNNNFVILEKLSPQTMNIEMLLFKTPISVLLCSCF